MSATLRLCSLALAAVVVLSLSAVAQAAPGGTAKAAAKKCRATKSHKRAAKCKKATKKKRTKHRAAAAVSSFEAESMSRSGSFLSIASDSTASGGKMLRFLGNGSASITQTLPAGDGL